MNVEKLKKVLSWEKLGWIVRNCDHCGGEETWDINPNDHNKGQYLFCTRPLTVKEAKVIHGILEEIKNG